MRNDIGERLSQMMVLDIINMIIMIEKAKGDSHPLFFNGDSYLLRLLNMVSLHEECNRRKA